MRITKQTERTGGSLPRGTACCVKQEFLQPLKPKARPCADVVGLRDWMFFEKTSERRNEH